MSENAIELRRVTRMFGSKRAVDSLSLEVAKGAVFGLIGPNGAGKTTTFSMVAGYIRPTSGEVRVLGCDPQDTPRLKGRFGVLPQDAVLPASEEVGRFLLDMAALQGMPRAQREPAARDVLTQVGGETWWKLTCGKLSHGMAKRVGLAQAMLGAPELILLDEPTAGLDPKVAYQLRQTIKSLRGKHTVVVSSHNLHELEEVCTSAAIIANGVLVSNASIDQLTASGSEIRIEVSEGPLPLDALRAESRLQSVQWDEASRTISIAFDPSQADAETIIGVSLRVLLAHDARIAGVLKGRSLEQRVMELT